MTTTLNTLTDFVLSVADRRLTQWQDQAPTGSTLESFLQFAPEGEETLTTLAGNAVDALGSATAWDLYMVSKSQLEKIWSQSSWKTQRKVPEADPKAILRVYVLQVITTWFTDKTSLQTSLFVYHEVAR